jgi:hypothetical protein
MGLRLSQIEIEELKKQGYTEAEIQQAMREIEREELQGSYGDVQQTRGRDPRQNSQMSSFATKPDENIIRWQLELNDILERAEHILRGDVPKFIDGQVVWQNNPHPEMNTLNEVGVQECMKILAMYVNRNTILSDYTNEEINFKVFDFSRAVNNLVFMRDYEYGLDTEEKRKNYEMLVTELKDIVHSAYKRALDGAEKRSLREMITVSQQTSTTSQLGNGITLNNNGQAVKERGMLNPMRYVKGKYV